MYLKSLTIKDSDGFVIRHVDFKMGVNIIKGDTVKGDDTSNTNSIGKTTLLRSIDFCLAGNWESLVNDKEIKTNRNNTVFDFFKTTSPNFELIITNSLSHGVSSNMKINRMLTIDLDKKGRDKVTVKNLIDGNEVSNDDLKSQLKLYLFGLSMDKPTFRQLIPKFIRSSDHQVSNVVRYLHPTTPNSTYEVLHLTLFGFSSMGLVYERITLENELKQKTSQVNTLRDLVSVGTQEANDLRQSQLKKLQHQYDTYQISKEYERENDQLNQLKESIGKVKNQINNQHLNLDVWQSRLEEITGENQEINAEAVKYMYEEAQLYNVKLQKKFEETLAFHSKMLQNEVQYIHNAIQKTQNSIANLEAEYSLKAEEYSLQLDKLAQSGSLAEYTELGNKINALNKEITENQAILSSYQSALDAQKKIKQELEILSQELEQEIKEFRAKLIVFNQYFSQYSKALSKGGYLLAIEPDKNRHFSLVPRPVDGDSHVGDGHKQSIIIAFDLAYVAYANNPTVKLTRPHFFTQDRVEVIDNHMFSKLIELADEVECQFIFPIIKDKLNQIPNFDETNVILPLDKDNKFFDIEDYQKNKRKALLFKNLKHLEFKRVVKDIKVA
ncbi:DUF2326 domain-containing protein [Psychrobacter sanguinis]|uniref:DUF2326 domain-containing protein n=1 Tax=Psychrobacter sanguinis TaxID=861445 RepID=UPI001D13952A|nr:DUF2326 domain-containing protein [Psychrobacter sanguinis]UEC24826.1 DUF2326 domain-containing protein [Psychrobacter sanguinis]